MIKNVAWDTKDKKISAVIFTLIFSSLLFFEAMRANYIESSYIYILFTAAASILFSLFFVTNIEGKWNRLFSAQGIISVATVIVTLGMTESQKMGTTSKEGFFALLITSLAVLLAQNFYLLPVAAIISAVMSSFTTKPEIQSLVISCAPAVIGISCITLHKTFKDSVKWKKIVFSIIFAVTQPVLLASFAYTIYCRRYTITFHNLITEVWDSAASLIAVVILIALALYAIVFKIILSLVRKEKTIVEILKSGIIVEIFGYFAVALMGIVPMFMEMKYVFISAMGIYMVLLAASKEGSIADEAFNGIVSFIDPRQKNEKKAKAKSKAKPKKKKI